LVARKTQYEPALSPPSGPIGNGTASLLLYDAEQQASAKMRFTGNRFFFAHSSAQVYAFEKKDLF
jgi:hypothetical protein